MLVHNGPSSPVREDAAAIYVHGLPPNCREIVWAQSCANFGMTEPFEDIYSLDCKRMTCGTAFSMIRRKLVEAVFHSEGSLGPNLDDAGQSYLSLIGMEYA
jgi:hypothetical protein